MGRLRQTNMNVPYLPEAGQFRNVVLHNFAVRRVTPPQVALENKLSGRVLSDFLESGPRPFGIDFDVWRYTRKELYALIVGAFERHDLLQILVRTFFSLDSVISPRCCSFFAFQPISWPNLRVICLNSFSFSTLSFIFHHDLSFPRM